jgi:hypothetical protein
MAKLVAPIALTNEDNMGYVLPSVVDGGERTITAFKNRDAFDELVLMITQTQQTAEPWDQPFTGWLPTACTIETCHATLHVPDACDSSYSHSGYSAS